MRAFFLRPKQVNAADNFISIQIKNQKTSLNQRFIPEEKIFAAKSGQNLREPAKKARDFAKNYEAWRSRHTHRNQRRESTICARGDLGSWWSEHGKISSVHGTLRDTYCLSRKGLVHSSSSRGDTSGNGNRLVGTWVICLNMAKTVHVSEHRARRHTPDIF